MSVLLYSYGTRRRRRSRWRWAARSRAWSTRVPGTRCRPTTASRRRRRTGRFVYGTVAPGSLRSASSTTAPPPTESHGARRSQTLSPPHPPTTSRNTKPLYTIHILYWTNPNQGAVLALRRFVGEDKAPRLGVRMRLRPVRRRVVGDRMPWWSRSRLWLGSVGQLHRCCVRRRVWRRVQVREPAQILVGHSHRVFNTVWSPLLRNTLASGSDDTTVRVWNTTNGTSVVLKGHTDNVRALEWSTGI